MPTVSKTQADKEGLLSHQEEDQATQPNTGFAPRLKHTLLPKALHQNPKNDFCFLVPSYV